MALGKFGSNKKRVFLEALRGGARRGAAARSVGISRETIRLHMHKDDGFRNAVDEAETGANECVEDALFVAAVGGHVTACQVWLYNRMPDRWADRRNVRIGGEPEHQITLREMSDEELLRHTRQLASRLTEYVGDIGNGAPLNRVNDDRS